MWITRCAVRAAVMNLALAVCAMAQTIPAEVLRATEVLTPEQEAAVRTSVAVKVQALVDAEDEQVGQLARDLSGPIRQSPSQFFLSAYASEVSNQLGAKAMASGRTIVRLNAMIIAAELDRSATSLITAGLKDPRSGVRYRAGLAIDRLAPQLPTENQTQILTALRSVVASETSGNVLTQLMLGLAALDTNEARQAILEAVDRRINIHANAPGPSVRPERLALEALHRNLIKQVGRNQAASIGLLKDLARVAYRCMALGAILLDDQRVAPTTEPEFWSQIQTSDRILRWTIDRLAGGEAPSFPPDVRDAVERQSTAEVQLIVGEWEDLLARPPASLQSVDMEVAIPAAS